MTVLWLIFALMTGAAVFVVLGALSRGRATADDSVQADAAVYRDQLDEIARDRARGLIDEREAEGARTEVARRLIAVSDRAESEGAGSTGRRRIAATVALVAIPAIALGGYGALGTPDLPDLPLAARNTAQPNTQTAADLVSRVEGALAKNPNDGRGWSVVAPIYMRLGRADDAARAYRNAIRLLGSTPEREADFGEALAVAADGVVTGDAREAFERSVAGEDPSVKGTFYLARAAEQDGDMAGALDRLKPLVAKAPEDAPYLETLRGELQRIADVPALPMPTGPEAASAKTQEERIAMVRSMVDGLDARLTAEGERSATSANGCASSTPAACSATPTRPRTRSTGRGRNSRATAAPRCGSRRLRSGLVSRAEARKGGRMTLDASFPSSAQTRQRTQAPAARAVRRDRPRARGSDRADPQRLQRLAGVLSHAERDRRARARWPGRGCGSAASSSRARSCTTAPRCASPSPT